MNRKEPYALIDNIAQSIIDYRYSTTYIPVYRSFGDSTLAVERRGSRLNRSSRGRSAAAFQVRDTTETSWNILFLESRSFSLSLLRRKGCLPHFSCPENRPVCAYARGSSSSFLSQCEMPRNLFIGTYLRIGERGMSTVVYIWEMSAQCCRYVAEFTTHFGLVKHTFL